VAGELVVLALVEASVPELASVAVETPSLVLQAGRRRKIGLKVHILAVCGRGQQSDQRHIRGPRARPVRTRAQVPVR